MNFDDISKNNVNNQNNLFKNFLDQEEDSGKSLPGFNESQMRVIKKGLDDAFEKGLMSDEQYDKAMMELSKFEEQGVDINGERQIRFVKQEVEQNKF